MAATQGRGRSLRRALLVCGILSSLLYAATDLIGGLLYPGYSFTAQTISELGAIGAPSKPIVDRLFMIYPVLALAFSAAVFREAAGGNRALRITGALLAAYTLVGAVGFTSAPMHRRGAGSLATDLPHIIVAALVVVLMLLALGVGALSLGRRFRWYSFATLLTVVVSGTLTAPYVTRIAAGQPTPGVGIIERITVYSMVVWLAVLAAALLRRREPAGHPSLSTTSTVNGSVAPGFEQVRVEFERNFAERGEIGAAVAVYWHGEKVVDLWGGRRTPEDDAPWQEDTMVVVMSTTKGLAAMTLALANARGWLDYDAPIASYWPEFAQNGKAAITVRQLLGHEAGLVLLDETLTLEKLGDLDGMARLVARQKPAWPPGTRRGYHSLTLGMYMQELIRCVDPAGRSLGRVFHEEIAVPLGLEFYIGLPREIPADRLARVTALSRWRGLLALCYTPAAVTMKMIRPGSLLRRSFLGLQVDPNDRRYLEIEVPAGDGVGTARAIARAYSAFAEGGAELGITPETFARIAAPPAVARPRDEVLGVPSYFSLGFLRPGPEVLFGSSPRAFGAPGAGGSFAFADPDGRLGYAYVMNKLDFYLVNDPREKALRDAVYQATRRITSRRRAVES